MGVWFYSDRTEWKNGELVSVPCGHRHKTAYAAGVCARKLEQKTGKFPGVARFRMHRDDSEKIAAEWARGYKGEQ